MDQRRPQARSDAQWKPGGKGSLPKQSKLPKTTTVGKSGHKNVGGASDELRMQGARITNPTEYQKSQKREKITVPHIQNTDVYCDAPGRGKHPEFSHKFTRPTIARRQVYQHSPSDSTTTTTANTTIASHDHDNRISAFDILSSTRPLYGRTVVELSKGDESNLGLTIADGSDPDEPPTIANIQTGSVADRSDRLLVGDRLLAIENVLARFGEDGTRSCKGVAEQLIRLEIEYKLPELPPAGCTVKHMTVDLETKADGIGLVLRGGWSCLPSHNRPLTVMRIREGSMAGFDGRIKPGDRIAAINNVQTGRLSCEESVKLIDTSKYHVNLLVEYNVANFEADRSVSQAVMVEIEKPTGEDLGISLAPCHEIKTGQNAFFINYLRQGSIADRCGALCAGDRVEAIDDIRVEDLTLPEAMRRLKNNGLDRIRLQIVPNAVSETDHQSKMTPMNTKETSRSKTSQQAHRNPSTVWRHPTAVHSIHSKGKLQSTARAPDPTVFINHPDPGYAAVEFRSDQLDETTIRVSSLNPKQRSLNKSLTSLHSTCLTRSELWRCEEVEVCLDPDDSGRYGFTLGAPSRGAVHDTQLVRFPVVEHVEVGGSAFKSGVIQEGDRVITIDGQSTLNRTIEELNKQLVCSHHDRQRLAGKLVMVTQYSVADNVVPAAGVFDVRLARRAANLGINLQASIKKQDGQPLLISKVIPGSVASRSGSISAGDVLLAVNGVPLSSCSLAEAICLLQSPSEEIVTLRVQKIDSRGSAPICDEMFCRHNVDPPRGSSSGFRCKRGDSVPESVPDSGNSSTIKIKTKSNTEPNTPEIEPDEEFLVSSTRNQPVDNSTAACTHPEFITQKATVTNQERLNSGQGDQPKMLETKQYAEHAEFTVFQEPFFESTSRTGSSAIGLEPRFGNERRRLFSSPEDLSQDEGVSIIRVVLKRKSADLPWGIIICGTDEASNAPVFIDSLTSGDPGAMSGLLFPGDRILAINGSALHAGHTLTQAMRMLQRYPDKVILHVARTNRNTTEHNLFSGVSDTAATKTPEETAEVLKQQNNGRISLKKAVATGNFSRSFDSATNSIGSVTAATAVTGMSDPLDSKLLRDPVMTCGQPIGTQGTRPKSTSSIRTLPAEMTTDKRSYSEKEPETINLSSNKLFDTPLIYLDQRAPSMLKGEIPDREGSLDISHSKQGQKPSNSVTAWHVEPRATRSCPSSQVYAEQAFSDPVDRYTDDSSSDPVGRTVDVPECADSYPFLADYSEMDLERIQCPGCREAIINELKQQQEKVKCQRPFRTYQVPVAEQRADQTRQGRGKASSRQSHSRRRTKSDPRGAGTSTDLTDQRFSIQTEQTESAGHSDYPKATFFCPEQELGTCSWNYYSHLPGLTNVNSVNRFSKSDSRINLTGIEQLELENYTAASVPHSGTPKTMSKSVTARANTAQTTTFEGDDPSDHRVLTARQRQSTNRWQQHVERYRHLELVPRESETQLLDHSLTTPGSRISPGSTEVVLHRTVRQSERPAEQQNLQSHRHQERGVWCTWIRLTKASPNDSYGIGVSEGLSTKGIFVSAIRPNSPADKSGQLHLYDRILMINDQDTEGLSCSEVVGLISRSDRCLDLLIQRRITRSKRQYCEPTRSNPPLNITDSTKPTFRSKTTATTKRVPNTNLSII